MLGRVRLELALLFGTLIGYSRGTPWAQQVSMTISSSPVKAAEATEQFSVTVTRVSNASGAQITITIHNETPIPQNALDQAIQEASRIFHNAGLNTVWIVCQVSNAGPSTSSDCLAPVDLTHLSLRIVPWSSQMSDSTFGLAFLSERGLGTYSDVFYPPAENLSRHYGASLGRVLGHVMAHEIGHLLLGTNAHSPFGIMRPQWQGEELRQIGMGTLLFTPEQARRMHARLLKVSVNHLAGDSSAPLPGN